MDAAELMRQLHVGSVVVVDEGGRPLGMLTDRDIVLRVVAEHRDPAATPVASVMSSEVACVQIDDLIDEAAFKMRQKGVRRLPIVDAVGKVCGIVALDDLLVLLSAELEQAAAAVRENQGP